MFTSLQMHLAGVFLKIFLRNRQAILFSLFFPLIFIGAFSFSGGERDSVWTTWYKNGNKKLQATYFNGKLNGKYTSWYDGGIIKEKDGDYLENKKHNKWTYWSNKGQKIEEVNYDNGTTVSYTHLTLPTILRV